MNSVPHRRWWPATIRWLHTYLSLLGFAALLFFAVTGLTLNHAAFFEGDEPTVVESTGELPASLLPADDTAAVDRLAIAEWLRAQHRLHGRVTEFDLDADAGTLVFKAPAYSADVGIDRSTRHYQLRVSTQGVMTVLDDLHKGRDSGDGWSWVIDVSAVVMAMSAITGLWLLLYLRKRRRSGLVVAAVGTVVLATAYFVLVP